MAVTSIEQLRAIYGDPSDVARDKQIAQLDDHCRTFIGRSPFLVLATAHDRAADASPKGDEPGFVQIDEAGHLLIPDWPGNRRLDGLTNIVGNPWVGVLFIIPGIRETLRVNGEATIHDEPAILGRFDRQGRHPITVLRVAPHEVFLHCAKAFMRSKLWEPESWPDRSTVPGMVEMLKAHTKRTAYPSEAELAERLKATLY